MRRSMHAGSVTVLVGLASCATRQYIDVGSVVTEVRTDEVAAVANYQDRVVALKGRVADKGMKSGTAIVTEGTGVPGAWSAHSVRVKKNYGYLVFAADADAQARAVCLFEPEMLEQIAHVKVGQSLDLRCMLSGIV